MNNLLTDLENFTELYKSFGIECVIIQKDDHQVINIGDLDNGYGDGKEGTYSDKFTGGYPGFYSEVKFDKKGKFINQSFRE